MALAAGTGEPLMSRWLKILGAATILLGVVLFWSPRVAFRTSEQLEHTHLRVRRERFLLVPRAVAGLIIGVGVAVLILGAQKKI